MVGAAPWFGGSDVGACMELESTHDIGRHGVLVALDDERTPLASLADLVRHQMRCSGLALVEAVDAVVCMLKAQGDALVLYCTDPKTRARPIDLAEPFTSAAMLGRLRQAWAVDSTTAADLNGAPFARLTMRRDVADWLFECGPDISFWDAAPSEPASVVPAHDADWMQAQDAALMFVAAPPAGDEPAHADALLLPDGKPISLLAKLPEHDDGPGCRALYDEWVKLGGEQGGAGGQLATRFGCSPRTIQLRIKPFRDANEPGTKAARASKRPKPKGVGAGVRLQATWAGVAPAKVR